MIVVTSPNLSAVAALSDKGGYGAGQRVSVSLREDKTEVAFINPLYIQHAYRLEGDLQSVYDQLSLALGNMEAYGAKKKMTAKIKKRAVPMGQPSLFSADGLGTGYHISPGLISIESQSY